MTVLFASAQSLERAEDIKAVWDAYNGNKKYTRLSPWRTSYEIHHDEYDLLVTDEYPSESKAPVIMVGHGICGGKKYGLDQPYPYFTKENAKLLTWVIGASKNMTDMIARRSGVDPSQVLPYGKPKTDNYLGMKKGDGGTGLHANRIYLYAPTYRTAEEMPYPKIDFELIDSLLTDDELFIIKPHMATHDELGFKKHIIHKHILQLSPQKPSTPYLVDSDVLVTDYSSILFDAHVLGKPVVLFEKDNGRYLQSRGMYRPYPSGYASRHTTDETELVQLIREARKPLQEDIDCLKETAGACDGHSTERIVKLIGDMINGHEKAL